SATGGARSAVSGHAVVHSERCSTVRTSKRKHVAVERGGRSMGTRRSEHGVAAAGLEIWLANGVATRAVRGPKLRRRPLWSHALPCMASRFAGRVGGWNDSAPDGTEPEVQLRLTRAPL